MQIVAAVARERTGSFSIEKLDLADPRPDELLVRIVASGTSRGITLPSSCSRT